MELPVEMITHVMIFLAPSDLFSATLVSKTWYAASRDPCLQSEVDVTLTMSPSKQILTKFIPLNQSKVNRLQFNIAHEISHWNKKFATQPSYSAGSCHCYGGAELSAHSMRKATLFGITFKTLVLPRKITFRHSIDSCIYLLKGSSNLQSLGVSSAQLPSGLSTLVRARMKSALHNITHVDIIRLDRHTVGRIDVTCFSVLQTIKVGAFFATSLREFEHLRRLCDNSANDLKVYIDYATLHFSPTEELKDLLSGGSIHIRHLSIRGGDTSEGNLPWLKNICHNIENLYLPRKPNLEMLESIQCNLSTSLRVLQFPYDASNTSRILSILTRVRTLVFKGPLFELRLGRRPSSGINLILEMKQDILEPTVEIVSSIIEKQPLLGRNIGMAAYPKEGGQGILNEALSTFDGLEYLIVKPQKGGVIQFPKTAKVTELRSLSLHIPRHVGDQDVDEAVLRSPMPHLQDLYLPDSHLSDEGLRSLARYASDMRRLNIGSCSRITDEGILTVLINCRRLERLCIQECRSLTDKSIEYIAEHGISLQYLQVVSSDNYYNRAKELLRGIRVGWI